MYENKILTKKINEYIGNISKSSNKIKETLKILTDPNDELQI